MKIAFVNLGSLNYILASTCILKRIRKYNYNFNIDFVLYLDESIDYFFVGFAYGLILVDK